MSSAGAQRFGSTSMAFIYASIPMMIFAVSIAVLPLVWAMVDETRRNALEILSPVAITRNVALIRLGDA